MVACLAATVDALNAYFKGNGSLALTPAILAFFSIAHMATSCLIEMSTKPVMSTNSSKKWVAIIKKVLKCLNYEITMFYE